MITKKVILKAKGKIRPKRINKKLSHFNKIKRAPFVAPFLLISVNINTLFL